MYLISLPPEMPVKVQERGYLKGQKSKAQGGQRGGSSDKT